MKLKASHFIPGYGTYKYFKEYYNADRRDAKEAVQASWMFMYQVFSLVIAILIIVKILFF